MKPLVVITGPRDAGPGEKDLMMERANAALQQLGVDSPTRIDVPPKGTAGDDNGDANPDTHPNAGYRHLLAD